MSSSVAKGTAVVVKRLQSPYIVCVPIIASSTYKTLSLKSTLLVESESLAALLTGVDAGLRQQRWRYVSKFRGAAGVKLATKWLLCCWRVCAFEHHPPMMLAPSSKGMVHLGPALCYVMPPKELVCCVFSDSGESIHTPSC